MKTNNNVSFYKRTVSPIERLLPKILEKTYSENKSHCFILCEDSEQMKFLNDSLWSIGGRNFLPHDDIYCSSPSDQPILLGDKVSNLNNSTTLLNLTDYIPETGDFNLIIDIFSGLAKEETEKARVRFKRYKELQYNIKYWEQDSEGSWHNQM